MVVSYIYRKYII